MKTNDPDLTPGETQIVERVRLELAAELELVPRERRALVTRAAALQLTVQAFKLDGRDTEPAPPSHVPSCGVKRRSAGHVYHCTRELDHAGECDLRAELRL